MKRHLIVLLIVLPVILTVRSVIIEPYRIPSGSMIPALQIGDHIFVNKLEYGLRFPFTNAYITTPTDPKRGDVVVFLYPKNESINYIKRVVGLPGETIEVKDRVVYIDGEAASQVQLNDSSYTENLFHAMDRRNIKPFATKMGDLSFVTLHDVHQKWSSKWGPKKVPDGHFFVMGDNRDRSSDSRAWGFVPRKNIKGKAMFVWLSLDLGLSEEADFQFRSDRFFQKIE